MKKQVLTFGLILTSFSFAAQATTEYDMKTGFDFTGATSVTPAQLNQAINNAVIKAGKGGIIASVSPPDVVSNTRYTNWVWMDQNFSPPILKTWAAGSNTNTPNASTNWVIATVPALSVGNGQLQLNAVTWDKIATNTIINQNLATNLIANNNIQPGAVQSNSIANGSIYSQHLSSGAVLGANIGWQAIGGTNIALNTIGSSNLNYGLINSNYLAPSGIQGTNIATNTITGTLLQALTITSNLYGNGSIYNTNIAAGTIDTNSISTNLIAGIRHWSPVKAFCRFASSGPALVGSGNYNVASIVNNGNSSFTISFTTPLISTNYIIIGSGHNTGTITCSATTNLTTGVSFTTYDYNSGTVSPTDFTIEVLGDF